MNEIMTDIKAIECLEQIDSRIGLKYINGEADAYVPDYLRKAVYAAIQALQEKLERENPQPLGLEELQKMDGEPIWIHWIGRLSHRIDCWKIIKTHDTRGTMWDMNGYDKTWIAYRHKPDLVNVNKIEHISEAAEMLEPEWKKRMMGNFTKNH